MPKKYAAFDIETAKVLPGSVGDLKSHRPLGISCAALWGTDQGEPELFYSQTFEGSPAPRMSQQDASALVDYLEQKVEEGYTIVTHNGIGFDFDILAEESDRFSACRRIALEHVDMMYHFFCGKGFPIALDKAAEALNLDKKSDIDGSRAPKLWKEGRYERVLEYVGQDCRLTLQVAEKSEESGYISWITRKGAMRRFELPSGWLSVEKASELPKPDTSWMDNPWKRSKFTGWLD